MKFDCAVIGAGVSGLTAAVIMAGRGKKVALIEKGAALAPVVRGFKRRGSYFDTGFHCAGAMGPGQILSTYFKYLKIDRFLTPVPFAKESFDRVAFADSGFEFSFPQGYEAIREALVRTFPHESKGIDEYLRLVRSSFEDAPYLNLNADINVDIVSRRISGPSLWAVLCDLFDDEKLKSVLCAQCMLYGLEPEESPFFIHAVVAGSYYQSAYGLKGGGLSLARAFEARLQELGVEVFTANGAKQVHTNQSRELVGIELQKGDFVACEQAVCTIHPRNMLDIVPEKSFRPAYIHRILDLQETSSALLVFARQKPLAGHRSGENLYVLTGSGPRIWTGEKDGRQPVFVSFGEPGACGGVVVIVPAAIERFRPWSDSRTGRRDSSYRKFKSDLARKVLAYLEEVQPKMAGSLELVDCATPLTLRDYANTPLGGLYGVRHCLEQFNPAPQTRIKGFYLAGQSIVSPGILGAMLSGFYTCGAMCGHEFIREELRGCC